MSLETIHSRKDGFFVFFRSVMTVIANYAFFYKTPVNKKPSTSTSENQEFFGTTKKNFTFCR